MWEVLSRETPRDRIRLPERATGPQACLASATDDGDQCLDCDAVRVCDLPQALEQLQEA